MLSVELEILHRISNHPKGKIFVPDDFIAFGSQKAIHKALERLCNKNEILRISRGIFTRPKRDKQLGLTLPSAEEIAQSIAKRDHVKIVPSGAQALHLLGLSEQVPLNLVYLTDGSPRIINIGARSIRFKRTSPKNLKAKGEISSLVIQALRSIGKDGLDKVTEDKIHQILKKEDPKKLNHDLYLPPVWIREILQNSYDRISTAEPGRKKENP